MRRIDTIAREISKDWIRPYYGAMPYLAAMHVIGAADEKYGVEEARDIIRYFLSNAASWRGETARRVKAELKAML